MKPPGILRKKFFGKNFPKIWGVYNLPPKKSGVGGPPFQPGAGGGFPSPNYLGSFWAPGGEVWPSGGAFRCHRMIPALDSGPWVTRPELSPQFEGATAFGWSAALYRELTLRDGRVQQETFTTYRVLRLSEMPRVEAYIVPSTEKPGGVGEPGVPPVAPAVANAVFALTGKRLRSLPLNLAM